MRFSSAVASALVLAPLSMAGQVHNEYPRDLKKALSPRAPKGVEKRTQRESGMEMKSGESAKGGKKESEAERMQGVGREAAGGNSAQGSAAPVIIIWTSPGGGAERQAVNDKASVTEKPEAGKTASGVAEGASATHTIKVGGPAGLVYEPAANKFEVGSMVIWEFYSNNHTVTQSTFEKPCEKMEGGFDSGFMPNPNNTINPPPQVAMQVMTSEPLWFKCSQGKHCQQGMVASINAKDGEKSHSAFQELAIKSGGESGASKALNSTAPAGSESGSKTGGMGAGEGGMSGKEGKASPEQAGSEAGSEAGGARGQVGAAESEGKVVKGQFKMVNGVMACVASCGEGGESPSVTKRAENAEAGGEAGGACSVLCVKSSDAARGVQGSLPIGKAGMTGRR